MDKKTVTLDSKYNQPFEIEMNGEENETHALIRLVREKQCKSFHLILNDNVNTVEKNIPAKEFNQINLLNFSKFSITAEFIDSAESYVEFDVYTGTREEMLLTEVELSFSASPFYISCNSDDLEFVIGEPNHSQLSVKHDPSGGFLVTTSLVKEANTVSEIKNTLPDDGESAQVIGRLYGRIKGRVNGKGFHERQEENKELYNENLNKTLTEAFQVIS